MSSHLPPHDRQPPADWRRNVPRFRLRTLLLGIAVLSVLFTLAARLGAVWSVALGWTALLVAAHVLGNAWGTRTTRQMPTLARPATDGESPAATDTPIAFAPATRLHRSSRLGWRTILLTVLGAVAGGAVATVGLIALYAERQAYAGIALGIVCSAALGGFFGFLAASSIGMTLHAMSESAKYDRPPR